jgi:hypothetical protein
MNKTTLIGLVLTLAIGVVNSPSTVSAQGVTVGRRGEITGMLRSDWKAHGI